MSEYQEKLEISPIPVRLRFLDQFLNISDLTANLYRDLDREDDPLVKDYIRELIRRLNNLRN